MGDFFNLEVASYYNVSLLVPTAHDVVKDSAFVY